MTIPGKGGRPRKWRSDADRQRAWRARQSGLGEPPTVAEALDEGDELARVWEIVRDLGEHLDQAKVTIADLQRERDQLRREYEREWRRCGWLESRIKVVEAERDRLEVDLGELAAEMAKSRPECVGAEPASDPRLATHVQAPLSRARRRQLERAQRRRRT